ncbi:FAD-dependent oxidoreductase [Sphingomonas sp. 22R3R2A-7]|uniref:FAD-dependent oxidoreductase n=1 Tax=Sphingomonas sp. 22R3R2A-7 TaxID=3050230 RepID=UPI002FE10874
MDAAARKAVVDDWDDYILGMFYFILYSGDSRIPASLVTALQGYGLDALHYCDPAVEGRYGLQDRIYTRDPIWQLNAPFKLTGADISNGQAGLRSTKTVGYSAYRYDQHDKRRVAYDDGSGMALWRQGVVGGSNASLSIAAEAMQGPVTGAQFLYAPSFSKIFHSNARMEFTLTGMGQSAGVYASLAIDGGVPVPSVSYPTARAAILAGPYSTPLYIPQS